VVIDASQSNFVHFDVIEIIEDFNINAKHRNINLDIIDLYKDKKKKPSVQFEIETEK